MAHNHANACPIPDEICAAYREQQRIIQLIEDWCAPEAEFSTVDYLIACIKGEN